MKLRTIIAAFAVLALAGCDLPTYPADASTPDEDLLAVIELLEIADEQRDGYDRDQFTDWTTTDGCTTREWVLIEEDTTGTATAGDCGSTIPGEWHSSYDGVTVTDPGSLDIDHVVPLAEAWDSGAHAWTAGERADYATWLDDPDHLIAVTARSNRAKADADPAQWMPPNETVWCEYIVTWTQIKLAWDLTVDQTEYHAITSYATNC